MKNLVLVAGALAGMAFAAAPAAAVVPLVNSPITVTTADVGKSFTYNFNGVIDPNVVTGLNSAITFTLTGVAGKVWSFSAFVNNNLSTAPVSGRITGFGFDGNPEITGAKAISGPFTKAVIDAGFPQIGGQTKIDFCLTDGPNCSGGAGVGMANGTTATQVFDLSFANPITSVTFNHFIVRYLSVQGTTLGNSAIGLGTGGGGFDGEGGGVPEPATWAMLLSGFGLVGFAARRRRGVQSVAA